MHLIGALRGHARAAGAERRTLSGTTEQQRLAAMVQEAETFQRSDPGHAAVSARWSQPYRSCRLDGVPAEASWFHPDSTLLAGRDFTGWARHSNAGGPKWTWPARTELVALLDTPHDTPQDWLRAGQALQRVLLYAAAHKVGAGFHTRPLEDPPLRAEVRTMIASRPSPQMILRLGHTDWTMRTPDAPSKTCCPSKSTQRRDARAAHDASPIT
ncbi:hypothetical protein H9Y04_15035 [Streptomyces sp. TRM66268-LWL]|uniref:Uncharacterized protein n=1 Tax=Streptomyces polyasparticus TaxID=2767826 RepID=A0ABR7SEP3_9ACTN|nr:hypothetical protein [Streptomyces polyasparticus]MBC9713883.1 hypothetical protein [Streptomyces polyasparticus]